MNTGTTLEILRTEGKTPLVKDWLIKKEIGTEISCFKSFRILIGILFGPDDLDGENELITLVTSSGVVWDRNIELELRLRRNLEKWLYVGGISDLMESAIDVKKSLKELATVSGLVVTESPILIEIGEADFPF